MTVYITNRMELFSLAYIEAIAASIGAQVGSLKVDNHSVDGTIVSSAGKCPRIDFQAKATYSHQFASGSDKLTYGLKVSNYNDLKSERCTPIILIMLVMPPTEADWLAHDHDALILRNCAYWKSLANYPATSNTSSINIVLDKSDCLSPSNLMALLDKAEKGETL